MTRKIRIIRRVLAGQEAAVATEYALLLIVVAVACVGLKAFGLAVATLYTRGNQALP